MTTTMSIEETLLSIDNSLKILVAHFQQGQYSQELPAAEPVTTADPNPGGNGSADPDPNEAMNYSKVERFVGYLDQMVQYLNAQDRDGASEVNEVLHRHQLNNPWEVGDNAALLQQVATEVGALAQAQAQP
jgi:HAMP domain-containing protein